MFRSQTISCFSLIMPQENAWAIMNCLGHLSKIQMIDLNPQLALINRPFANYIKRCDDLLLKLQYFIDVAKELNLIQHYKKQQIFEDSNNQQHDHTYLDRVEEMINKRALAFQEHKKHYEQLIEQEEYIQNYIQLLIECQKIIGDNTFSNSKIDNLIGIIKNDELLQFERVIFRISRGNSIVNIKILDQKKSLFIILFPNFGNYGKSKLSKVTEQMSQGKFIYPENLQKYDEKMKELQQKQLEIKNLISLTYNLLCQSICQMLAQRSNASLIEHYRLFLIKEKELYTQLNKLKMQGRLFLGELWIPNKDIILLEQALFKVKEQQYRFQNPGGQLAKKYPSIQYPTYFNQNEFTKIFQEIVNTYGIPRYKEINPALISIITFPFLFGVMFGDIGHGFILFIFGLIICFKKSKTFHQLRYIIILMGAFSFYCGFIYNDYLGLSIDLFGSCKHSKIECIYIFGIDPVWGQTLEFNDSFKMKLSILIAFCHMSLGIFLSGLNYIHSQEWINFTCKFIPQIIFFLCTIGYMSFLIIYKWITPFMPSEAPSIITTMISMVLNLGRIEGLQMWEGNSQDYLQYCLLIITIITIPWMWLPNIINSLFFTTIKNQNEGKLKTHRIDYGQLMEEIEMTQIDNSQIIDTQIPSNEHKKQNDFSDLLVHETIETIEFVLGVISNTASYLRLWALSLAHSQLAEVFFKLLLAQPIYEGQLINLVLGYPFWALITFGVLMCMDSMECFLHSLRLHWVEFQGKFYKGDGILFQVYSFKQKMQESIGY